MRKNGFDYLSAPRINVFQENYLQDELLCGICTTGKWVEEVREGTTQPRSHRQVCKDQEIGLERMELTTRDSDPRNPGDNCFHSGTLYTESNPDFCYSERGTENFLMLFHLAFFLKKDLA